MTTRPTDSLSRTNPTFTHSGSYEDSSQKSLSLPYSQDTSASVESEEKYLFSRIRVLCPLKANFDRKTKKMLKQGGKAASSFTIVNLVERFEFSFKGLSTVTHTYDESTKTSTLNDGKYNLTLQPIPSDELETINELFKVNVQHDGYEAEEATHRGTLTHCNQAAETTKVFLTKKTAHEFRSEFYLYQSEKKRYKFGHERISTPHPIFLLSSYDPVSLDPRRASCGLGSRP